MQAEQWEQELINIGLCRVGDTILHNNKAITLSNSNLKRGGFMGSTICGDSYHNGLYLVTLLVPPHSRYVGSK